MHQFEMGEQPKAAWFPSSETWPALIEEQAQRDAVTGAHMAAPAQAVAARSTNDPRPAPLSFEKSAEAFQAADDPVSKARIILQNPEFLEMALKQDAETARSLASLCDSFAQTLSMELDEKNRMGATPSLPATGTEAPVARMRM